MIVVPHGGSAAKTLSWLHISRAVHHRHAHVTDAATALGFDSDAHPAPSAPWITVNSRNEWTEACDWQPNDLYGYGYPEAVKKAFTE